MKVTTIASSPRASTGPPFERLYAVEPAGLAQIIPSHGCTPMSSPPSAHASSTMRPLSRAQHDDVVDGSAAEPVDLDLQRREMHDAVVAGEHAGEAGLELVRLDRREEPDPAEVDADDGDLGAEKPLQRAQHRSVAAEDDGYVGVREIVLRLADAVLLHLLVRQEQLDSRLARNLLQPFERRADGLRLPVRDDGGASHGLR